MQFNIFSLCSHPFCSLRAHSVKKEQTSVQHGTVNSRNERDLRNVPLRSNIAVCFAVYITTTTETSAPSDGQPLDSSYTSQAKVLQQQISADVAAKADVFS